MASKGGKECRKGDTVSVALADLQDMQNHMRETIDQGMQELQAKQGKADCPPLRRPPKPLRLRPGLPKMLRRRTPMFSSRSLNNWRKAIRPNRRFWLKLQPTAPPHRPRPAADAAPPVTIAMGQTIDEVTAALGPPKSIVESGTQEDLRLQGHEDHVQQRQSGRRSVARIVKTPTAGPLWSARPKVFLKPLAHLTAQATCCALVARASMSFIWSLRRSFCFFKRTSSTCSSSVRCDLASSASSYL